MKLSVSAGESVCVGRGPSAHCKHVSVAIYALANFASGGELITHTTCTQKLQTFHHAKEHKGTPMKAETLISVRGQKRKLIYDPRPVKYRLVDGHQDTSQNKCVNFQANHPNKRMPVLQLIPPASSYGLYHDHDYFQYTMEDYFLRKYNISTITPEMIQDIEAATKDQHKCGRWTDERQMRVTASNFGTVCKATERRDMERLANGLITPKNLTNKAVQHGKKYESVAIAKYCKDYKTNVKSCGLFVSNEHPYLGATPDGICNDCVVEVKCPFSARNKKIDSDTVKYIDNGTTNHDYHYQVQGQLLCTGLKKAKFIVFTTKDMKVLNIDRDGAFINDMVRKLTAFYIEFFRAALLDKFLFKSYFYSCNCKRY